ncbi:MAG: dTDP-4-keto-6-deoxy-D-glucose epimerase [Clostridia bacterium]|nr:dTDP-4-keto-6-deoxy-D-glucose epimerase [Clostridia bacterium]
MKSKTTNINGLLVIEGLVFEDLRGYLAKPYSTDFLPEDVNRNFKEVWFTKSKLNVIRGMHLQVEPFACEKLVSAIYGMVEDVILDLRRDSPTYGKHFSIILDGNRSTALYIPRGCAHGYKVLENNSIVMYMATEINNSSCDVGVLWNSFGYNWNLESPILSERDSKLPPFVYGQTLI